MKGKKKPTPASNRAVFLAVSALCLATRMCAHDGSVIQNLHLDSVELTSVGQDGFDLSIVYTITSSRPVKIRNLVFEQVRLGGVPMQVPSMETLMVLHGKKDTPDLMPELRAHVAYRDLESLEPLRRAVLDGRATLQVEARAQLELRFFEKVALRTWGPWAAVKVDGEVPVNVPGGTVGRWAVAAALTAADPVWIAQGEAREWRRQKKDVALEALDSMRGRIVALETTYTLRNSTGLGVPMDAWFIGFQTGPRNTFVAPAEALEPWLFDEAQAQRIVTGEMTVHPDEVELVAWTTGDSGTLSSFSSRQHQLRLVKVARDGATGISPITKKKYTMRFRNSEANFALFEIPGWNSSTAGFEAFTEANTEWQPAAVGRLDRTAATPKLTLWVTEARLENGRYRLKEPVDATAIGSPLWVSGGVVGMVQDGRSAMVLRGKL